MGNVMSSEIFSAEIRRLEEGYTHTHTHTDCRLTLWQNTEKVSVHIEFPQSFELANVARKSCDFITAYVLRRKRQTHFFFELHVYLLLKHIFPHKPFIPLSTKHLLYYICLESMRGHFPPNTAPQILVCACSYLWLQKRARQKRQGEELPENKNWKE